MTSMSLFAGRNGDTDIGINGKWLCANVDGYFPFLLAYISLFGSHSLKASHSPSFFCSQFMRILLILFYRSDLCSPFTTRPVFPCLTFATPWTVACQAALSIGFPRQEYWSGSFPSPGDLPNPGIAKMQYLDAISKTKE